MKKARVYCWKIFKSGLTDTPLKRFSYIEKEEDVLYYLPRQTSAHYGYELVSCLNCGEIYANDISAELYIESREKRLQKTNCIKCGKNLGQTAKPYPDFYLGQDGKINRSPEKFRYGDDAIVHEFWDLYFENKDQKEAKTSTKLSVMKLLKNLFKRDSLKTKILNIVGDVKKWVKRYCKEPFWIDWYGAYKIDPRYLTIWVCVKTDKTKLELSSNKELMAKMVNLLAKHNYPIQARPLVHIGFESEETVKRESKGNWYQHFK